MEAGGLFVVVDKMKLHWQLVFAQHWDTQKKVRLPFSRPPANM